MKRMLVSLMVMFMLLLASQSFAQPARQPQIEVFGGIAIPLAPDAFKDYFKMGFSPHIQYVMFPSARLGVSFGVAYEKFTFDGDKLKENMDLGGYEIDVTGSASNVELGVGLRPYLTAPEVSTQIFLFGMATYNLLKTEWKVSGYGNTEEGSVKNNKPGAALGAGLEIPASESMNLILQGIFRFIFTEDETTSFVGITAGLVF